MSFSYLCFAFRACFLARESTVLVPTCLLHSDFPLLRTVNHLALIQRKKHKQSVCYFLLFCTYVLACRTAACECALSGPWESKADSKHYLKVRNVFQEADWVSWMQKAFLITQDQQICYIFQTKINNVYNQDSDVLNSILFTSN